MSELTGINYAVSKPFREGLPIEAENNAHRLAYAPTFKVGVGIIFFALLALASASSTTEQKKSGLPSIHFFIVAAALGSVGVYLLLKLAESASGPVAHLPEEGNPRVIYPNLINTDPSVLDQRNIRTADQAPLFAKRPVFSSTQFIPVNTPIPNTSIPFMSTPQDKWPLPNKAGKLDRSFAAQCSTFTDFSSLTEASECSVDVVFASTPVGEPTALILKMINDRAQILQELSLLDREILSLMEKLKYSKMSEEKRIAERRYGEVREKTQRLNEQKKALDKKIQAVDLSQCAASRATADMEINPESCFESAEQSINERNRMGGLVSEMKTIINSTLND